MRLKGPGPVLVVLRTRETAEQEHLLATGAARMAVSGDWVLLRVPLPHRHAIAWRNSAALTATDVHPADRRPAPASVAARPDG
jgi:hypothetical protein